MKFEELINKFLFKIVSFYLRFTFFLKFLSNKTQNLDISGMEHGMGLHLLLQFFKGIIKDLYNFF